MKKEGKNKNCNGKVYYRVSKISIILAAFSLICLFIPDPIPVIDEAIAFKAFICFLILFIITFIAGSASSEDGCAEDFVKNIVNIGVLKMFGSIGKGN